MTHRKSYRWLAVVLVVSAVAGVGYTQRGYGYRTKLLDHVITRHPSVRKSRPMLWQADVDPYTYIAIDVTLPSIGHGVDGGTLSDRSVKLYRTDDRKQVLAITNTSGGGDAIVLQPMETLAPLTHYTFEVTSGVRDTSGLSFRPFSLQFTTGDDKAASDFPGGFERIPQMSVAGPPTIGLTIGPDGRLYSTTVDGRIFRYDIGRDGTLSNSRLINTVQVANWGPRMIPGIAFDPASTPDNLIAWVTHTQFSFDNGDDWTGKVSRLSGPNLEKYQDYVVGLPRSIRDHITATPVFGPDGAMYFGQPSNSAMGSPDAAWGRRPEHLLNAAILRFDPKKVAKPPLNVKTEGDGNYDPTAPDAPLTIYASGVRNAFNLLFHSNGKLYAPGNGSAAGGGTPGFDGGTIRGFRIDAAERGPYQLPAVPALRSIAETQSDFLFRIDRDGYYGHPNPTRNEFTMNGGNPTAGVDKGEVAAYPVGTQPDRNYRSFIHDFGQSVSPNGIIEYHGDVFGGALDGKLLVTRYSGGKDILVLSLDAEGNVIREDKGIVGFTQLISPIAIVEHRPTGNLYVAEFGATRIALLRPLSPGVHALAGASRLLFNDPIDGGASLPQKLSIRNVGTEPLSVDGEQIWFAGPDAHMFTIAVPPTSMTAQQGRSVDLLLAFNPPAGTTAGLKTATISVATNDPSNPTITIPLRGLATLGARGTNEPSLQRILDLYDIPVRVGDPDPETADLGFNPVTPNDEITAGLLEKALPDPVTIEPLACFGPSSSPVVTLSWYDPRKPATDFNKLFTVERNDSQTVTPNVNGQRIFDPGDDAFGLASTWPAFGGGSKGRVAYSQPARNVYATGPGTKAIRFYPLKNPDGTNVPFAYIFAIEALPDAVDAQDFVGIIRNVKPSRMK